MIEWDLKMEPEDDPVSRTSAPEGRTFMLFRNRFSLNYEVTIRFKWLTGVWFKSFLIKLLMFSGTFLFLSIYVERNLQRTQHQDIWSFMRILGETWLQTTGQSKEIQIILFWKFFSFQLFLPSRRHSKSNRSAEVTETDNLMNFPFMN